MKTRILTVVLLSCFSLLMMSNSCSPECEGDCGDNGECLEGECVCEYGYYGRICEREMLTDFPGTYSATIKYITGDTSFTTTNDITISVVSATNLEFQVDPISTGNQSHQLDANGTGRWLEIPEQVFPEGTFIGNLYPELDAPANEIQLELNATLTTPGRVYQVSSIFSRTL